MEEKTLPAYMTREVARLESKLDELSEMVRKVINDRSKHELKSYLASRRESKPMTLIDRMLVGVVDDVRHELLPNNLKKGASLTKEMIDAGIAHVAAIAARVIRLLTLASSLNDEYLRTEGFEIVCAIGHWKRQLIDQVNSDIRHLVINMDLQPLYMEALAKVGKLKASEPSKFALRSLRSQFPYNLDYVTSGNKYVMIAGLSVWSGDLTEPYRIEKLIIGGIPKTFPPDATRADVAAIPRLWVPVAKNGKVISELPPGLTLDPETGVDLNPDSPLNGAPTVPAEKVESAIDSLRGFLNALVTVASLSTEYLSRDGTRWIVAIKHYRGELVEVVEPMETREMIIDRCDSELQTLYEEAKFRLMTSADHSPDKFDTYGELPEVFHYKFSTLLHANIYLLIADLRRDPSDKAIAKLRELINGDNAVDQPQKEQSPVEEPADDKRMYGPEMEDEMITEHQLEMVNKALRTNVISKLVEHGTLIADEVAAIHRVIGNTQQFSLRCHESLTPSTIARLNDMNYDTTYLGTVPDPDGLNLLQTYTISWAHCLAACESEEGTED